jgi:hypothetical protein
MTDLTFDELFTRGEIRNRQQATQVRDFSGLRYGKITPTDIDGVIEYHNLAYVFIETKFRDAELPFGQRLAIERMVDDLCKRKPTIGLIASHNSSGDIDVANTMVMEIRFNKSWLNYRSENFTTKQVIDHFLDWVDKRGTK